MNPYAIGIKPEIWKISDQHYPSFHSFSSNNKGANAFLCLFSEIWTNPMKI